VNGVRAETKTYNVWGELTRVVRPGLTADYTYRADGLRHTKSVNGVRTTHVWDGAHMAAELNASGVAVIRFTRGRGGRLIHSQHHGWYLFNARGDVVQRVSGAGATWRAYRYTAFGVELNPVANPNPFRFAGEYYDAETGRIYLRARFYDPRLGRFTQPDPFWHVGNMQFGSRPLTRNGRLVPSSHAILQSGNLFVYTMNNPVMFIDPSGQIAILAPALKKGIPAIREAITTLRQVVTAAMAAAPVVAPPPTTTAPPPTVTAPTVRVDFPRHEPRTIAADIPTTRVRDVPRQQQQGVYFHATSLDNALSIMATGQMGGSRQEAGYVFAWQRLPSHHAVAHSGARIDLNNYVVIMFSTGRSFVPDDTIGDREARRYGPVVSSAPGPISVNNVFLITR